MRTSWGRMVASSTTSSSTTAMSRIPTGDYLFSPYMVYGYIILSGILVVKIAAHELRRLCIFSPPGWCRLQRLQCVVRVHGWWRLRRRPCLQFLRALVISSDSFMYYNYTSFYVIEDGIMIRYVVECSYGYRRTWPLSIGLGMSTRPVTTTTTTESTSTIPTGEFND